MSANFEPTFVDRGVSRGQHGGSLTAVNLIFLDRSAAINIGKIDADGRNSFPVDARDVIDATVYFCPLCCTSLGVYTLMVAG
jgi:hypothetical protein